MIFYRIIEACDPTKNISVLDLPSNDSKYIMIRLHDFSKVDHWCVSK